MHYDEMLGVGFPIIVYYHGNAGTRYLILYMLSNVNDFCILQLITVHVLIEILFILAHTIRMYFLVYQYLPTIINIPGNVVKRRPDHGIS